MGIRRNITISLILHTAMIVAVFSISYWERARPLPEDYMFVSLVKEFSGEKFFSVSQNYNGEGRPKQIKVAQKRFEPSDKKSLSQSLRMSDDNRLELTRGNKQNESFSGSKTKAEEDNRGVPDTNYVLSLFENIQLKSQYSCMSGEIFSHQGKEPPLLNNQPGYDGNSSVLGAIRSAIERAKGYPLLAREKGVEGTVLVSFTIDGKGLSKGIKIIKSSGYQILDEEVPRMLRRASPFPRFKGEIVIPITFKLNETTSDR